MRVMDDTVSEGRSTKPTSVHRVAVCGTSLLMSSVAALLAGRADVLTLPVDADVTRTLELLRQSHVEVVLFDLGAVAPEWAVRLLRPLPELVLLGIDRDSDEILVLSGQPSRTGTGDDLLRVIEEAVRRRCEKVDPAAAGRDQGGGQ